MVRIKDYSSGDSDDEKEWRKVKPARAHGDDSSDDYGQSEGDDSEDYTDDDDDTYDDDEEEGEDFEQSVWIVGDLRGTDASGLKGTYAQKLGEELEWNGTTDDAGDFMELYPIIHYRFVELPDALSEISEGGGDPPLAVLICDAEGMSEEQSQAYDSVVRALQEYVGGGDNGVVIVCGGAAAFTLRLLRDACGCPWAACLQGGGGGGLLTADFISQPSLVCSVFGSSPNLAAMPMHFRARAVGLTAVAKQESLFASEFEPEGGEGEEEEEGEVRRGACAAAIRRCVMPGVPDPDAEGAFVFLGDQACGDATVFLIQELCLLSLSQLLFVDCPGVPRQAMERWAAPGPSGSRAQGSEGPASEGEEAGRKGSRGEARAGAGGAGAADACGPGAGGKKKCGNCLLFLPTTSFTKTQLKKSDALRKCRLCMGPGTSGSSSQSTGAAAAAPPPVRAGASAQPGPANRKGEGSARGAKRTTFHPEFDPSDSEGSSEGEWCTDSEEEDDLSFRHSDLEDSGPEYEPDEEEEGEVPRELVFLRPDGETEGKDRAWLRDQGCFKVDAGVWSGPWYWAGRALQLRHQVEHFLSDSFLRREGAPQEYYRARLQNAQRGGWIPAVDVLHGPRIDGSQLTEDQLATALAVSRTIETRRIDGSWQIRRKGNPAVPPKQSKPAGGVRAPPRRGKYSGMPMPPGSMHGMMGGMQGLESLFGDLPPGMFDDDDDYHGDDIDDPLDGLEVDNMMEAMLMMEMMMKGDMQGREF